MSDIIEYRVRAVSRYVVTEHNPETGSTVQIAEVPTSGAAEVMAEAYALQTRSADSGRPAVAIPYTDAPPGKVMRCKVSLWGKTPNVAPAFDAEGKPLGRVIEVERDAYRPKPGEPKTYLEKVADDTDPMNYKSDGENLTFGVVCTGFDEKGNANVEENRIFGYWSPNVKMEMTVRNQSVLLALEKGAEYYVDFTPAPKP